MGYFVIFGLLLNSLVVLGLFYFGFKFIQNNKMPRQQMPNSSQVDVKKEWAEGIKKRVETLAPQHGHSTGDYCIDHPSEVIIGTCAISANAYCQHCLKTFQNIKIGKKFMNMFLDGEWEEFLIMQKSSINEPVDEHIIDKKRALWLESNIPIIVQNHFKINIINDEVEVFTVLQGRKNDRETLEFEFKEYKNKSIQ